MKTIMLLMAQYEKPMIPLKEICGEYFGMAPVTAAQRAIAGTLPVPALRLGKSQKCPWFIHINDLAQFIDDQRDQAVDEWRQVNC